MQLWNLIIRTKLGLNRRLRTWYLGRRGYEPGRFWEIWGRVFIDEEYQRGIYGQHWWLLERIHQIQPERIVEVGCGFGRNIRFLIEQGVLADAIIGLDLSSTMLAKVMQRYGLNKQRLLQAEAGALPLQDACCDLVFTFGLLMHVPEPHIGQVFGELLRVTRRHLIVIEQWDPEKGSVINEYTFLHDYESLFQQYNLEVFDRVTVTNLETMICLHGRVF